MFRFLKSSMLAFLLVLTFPARADEGMWLPLYLSTMGDSALQAMGFRISAEQLYSVNHSSLKDAVVLFGRGCTGVFVSKDGLLLTNHHCGYGAIQRLSSVDHDYITHGYWAKNREEELPAAGLTVSILVRMEDVTSQILGKMPSTLKANEKQVWLDKQIKNLIQQATQNTHYKAVVKEFDYGNQYILMVYEIFEDVRLVGAPPSFIGSFGGDYDNWEWPRHSGDFSVFRVYANKDNKPAPYNKDNVPYHPSYVPSISLKGVHENDFVFVYGFPGQTQHYLTEDGIRLITEKHNDIAVALRDIRLNVLRSFMQQNDTLFLLYANQYAGIANYWKKMKGESWGIKRVKGIEKRRDEIEKYLSSISSPTMKTHFLQLKDSISALYQQYEPYYLISTYLYEGWFSVGAVRYALGWLDIYDSLKKGKTPLELSTLIQDRWANFLKQYRYSVEKAQLIALLEKLKEVNAYPYVKQLKIWNELFNSTQYAQTLSTWMDQSLLFSQQKIKKFVDLSSKKAIAMLESDRFFKLIGEMYDYLKHVDAYVRSYESQLKNLYVDWVKLYYIVAEPQKRYPDANSTLRVAWGRVRGFQPRDAVYYNYYTTPQGVFEKTLNEVKDYQVDSTYYTLLRSKNYGRYANEKGELVLCFRSNTHTTGGNSGSPVFNERGELVGLNFDRAWEGTMSDLLYDENVCGNIVLDIRYCLWVIDVYARAGYLLDEMQLIH